MVRCSGAGACDSSGVVVCSSLDVLLSVTSASCAVGASVLGLSGCCWAHCHAGMAGFDELPDMTLIVAMSSLGWVGRN